MKDRLALAAAVGVLALVPPVRERDAPTAPTPVVRLHPRPPDRIVFREAPRYDWLSSWAQPSLYARDAPVVKRRRAA